jgi:hypothetical protein
MVMKKKPRQSVYLQYRCKDGSRTVAATASIGLLYWYDRVTPRTPIENPQPFEVYVERRPMAGPYNPLFLSLVVAGLERTYGKAPEIPQHLLEPAHYKKLAKAGSGDMEKHLKKGTPEIVEYEQVCLGILNWLKEQGEITEMILNEPLKPFAW